ncbi:hypothetical protein DICA3_D09648 [Diutina catenulata]
MDQLLAGHPRHAHNFNQLLARRIPRHQYVRMVWLGGVVPVPVVDYYSFWLHHRPYNWSELIRQVVLGCLLFAIKALRVLLLTVTALSYFNIISFPYTMISTHQVSREVVTFIFRDSKALLDRHCEIVAHNDDVLYFVDNSDDNIPILSTIVTTAINRVAAGLVTTCTTLGYPQGMPCTLVKDSLFFRFASVVERCVHPSSSTMLTIWVLAIFFVYVIIGDLIIANVLLFYIINVWRRVDTYKSVFASTMKVLWNTRTALF